MCQEPDKRIGNYEHAQTLTGQANSPGISMSATNNVPDDPSAVSVACRLLFQVVVSIKHLLEQVLHAVRTVIRSAGAALAIFIFSRARKLSFLLFINFFFVEFV